MATLQTAIEIAAAAHAACDPIACVAKLADNAANMDRNRIPQPTGRALARMDEYRTVRALRP